MNNRYRHMTVIKTIQQGACCALELAAKRGPVELELAWQRFTPRQRELVPPAFIDTLRAEAGMRASTTP